MWVDVALGEDGEEGTLDFVDVDVDGGERGVGVAGVVLGGGGVRG